MIQGLLQLSVLSLILASSVPSAYQQQPCAPTSCGTGPNISFPFYIPARQASNCGLPGFELNCTDLGFPNLQLPDNHRYVIQNISYADQILRVYDAALLTFDPNTTCLPKITNTSLPTSRFSFFNASSLHLFSLCRGNACTDLWIYRVVCAAQDDDQTCNLAIDESVAPEYLRRVMQSCETHIVAPVGFGVDNVYQALRRGFQLKWTTEDVNLEPPSRSPVASDIPAPVPSAYQHQPCSPTSCGNGPKISFPFHITSLQPSKCGLPGFELYCTDLGFPNLQLPDNHRYVIQDISYADQILRVYDAALLTFDPNTTCLPEITNTSLPTSRFSVFNASSLHLFPLCRRNASTGLWMYRVICAAEDDDQIWNLAIDDDADHPEYLRRAIQGCETHVVAPVNFGVDNFYQELRRGFQLKWTTEDVNLEPPLPSPAASDILAPAPPVAGKNVKGKGPRLWILVTGVTLGALVVAVSSVLLIFSRRKLLKLLSPQEADAADQASIELFWKNHGNLAPKRYKYSQLKKITNSFAENLGKGGFGTVYKGKIEDGRLVAVKILNGSKGNGGDFINEVSSISRTSHVNVVALLGFCFEGSKRALIYEFMPNGSLEKFIPNTSSSSVPEGSLGLDKLFEIAVGIGRGLEYLHQGCNTRILHFDIKPHNILLDKDLKPKISDFGLSKLCPNRSSIVSMQGARGTAGYIAPEVFCRNFGDVSHKSDVYSYGMMVLEMVVGRQNNINPEDGRSSEMNFSDWIYRHLEQNTVEKGAINKNVLQEGEWNFVKRKLIIIGLWCIQTDPKNRPSISKVMEMLEGKLESLPLPPRPYLSSSPISPSMFSNFEFKSLS